MRALLYHNPTAGAGNHDAGDVVSAVRAAGIVPDYRSSKDDVPAAAAAGMDLVIAAGGDGTVTEALALFRGHVRDFAILPLGTANNIARGFGIEGPPEQIARGLAAPDWRRLDIGLLTGPDGSRRVMESVGLGALAQAMAEAHGQDLASDEKGGFALARLHAILSGAARAELAVVADGVTLPDDIVMAEILNAPLVGPGIGPRHLPAPGDGLLEVAYLTDAGRRAVIGALEAGATRLPLEQLRARRVVFERGASWLRVDDAFVPPAGRPERYDVTLTEPVRIAVPRRAARRGEPT